MQLHNVESIRTQRGQERWYAEIIFFGVFKVIIFSFAILVL